MLDYSWPERLAMDTYSSLVGPFVGYGKNEVLFAISGAVFARLHILEGYILVQNATVLDYTWLEIYKL